MSASFLPADIKAWTISVAARYGLTAGQKMGQHFLIDGNVLREIVAAAQLLPQAKVLEVGGGLGVLTLSLLPLVKRLAVVELDARLVEVLKKITVGSDRISVLAGDALKLTEAELKQALQLEKNEHFVIVANLPYEITGAFLQKFLWEEPRPRTMTLLVQREVAERMIAPPGKMSLLSLSCQLMSRLELIKYIPSRAFWPAPKVQSAIIRLELLGTGELERKLSGVSLAYVWRLARIGFAARRKLLINNLASALPIGRDSILLAFQVIGISDKARAQELSPEAWLALARALPITKP